MKFNSSKHYLENHTILVFEVLEVEGNPDLCVIVTPLMRSCDDPWFENMGEAVDFLSQVLEVGHFLSYELDGAERYSGSRE